MTLTRLAQYCFAFALALGVLAALTALATFGGCIWPDRDTIREVPVYRTKYVHDAGRECVGLPEFPSVVGLNQGHYVRDLAAWIDRAAVCLQVPAYNVRGLVEEVTWDLGKVCPP